MEKSAQKNPDCECRSGDVVSLAEFVRREACAKRVKEVMALTGLSESSVQRLRLGERSLSLARFDVWCQRDPAFAARYMAHVGVIGPDSTNLAEILTRLANEVGRNA